MIKIQNNTLTRKDVPVFLLGLDVETLKDLSWTDPQLGVQDCAWWPEQEASPALGQNETYGEETLALGDGVVIVTRVVVPMTQEQIAAAEQAALLRQRKRALIAQIEELQNQLAAME